MKKEKQAKVTQDAIVASTTSPLANTINTLILALTTSPWASSIPMPYICQSQINYIEQLTDPGLAFCR